MRKIERDSSSLSYFTLSINNNSFAALGSLYFFIPFWCSSTPITLISSYLRKLLVHRAYMFWLLQFHWPLPHMSLLHLKPTDSRQRKRKQCKFIRLCWVLAHFPWQGIYITTILILGTCITIILYMPLIRIYIGHPLDLTMALQGLE